MRLINPLLAALLLFISVQAFFQVQLSLNTRNANTLISRHIYGHFSEHLGRCIYDGFWVTAMRNHTT